MRKVFLFIFLFFSLCSFAETNAIKRFLSSFKTIGGEVTVLEEYNDKYVRTQLNDSVTLEIYYCGERECDAIFMVMTVCAPQCSSIARVYSPRLKDCMSSFLVPLADQHLSMLTMLES